MLFQNQCGGSKLRKLSMRFNPHIIQSPSFVGGVSMLRSKFFQIAEEIQNEEASVMRESTLDFVYAILVVHIRRGIAEGIYRGGPKGRSRAALRVTTGRRILAILTGEILIAYILIGECCFNQRNAIFQVESPNIRAISGIVAVPGMRDIKIECNRDGFV